MPAAAFSSASMRIADADHRLEQQARHDGQLVARLLRVIEGDVGRLAAPHDIEKAWHL